jgi:hypothetical protein
MGCLDVSIDDTHPVSTGEGPRACAVTLCLAAVGRRHARARGARRARIIFIFFKINLLFTFTFILKPHPDS